MDVKTLTTEIVESCSARLPYCKMSIHEAIDAVDEPRHLAWMADTDLTKAGASTEAVENLIIGICRDIALAYPHIPFGDLTYPVFNLQVWYALNTVRIESDYKPDWKPALEVLKRHFHQFVHDQGWEVWDVAANLEPLG